MMIGSVSGTARTVLLVGSLITAAGCSYDAPATPDSPTTPGPQGATISITSSGLTPGAVTIAAGQSVTFVNNDSQPHEVSSGPVPTYDQCPGINRVGRLEPGQSMQTGALTTASNCQFLDLLRIGESRWQGTIAVQ
jgi:plastocyanin